MGKCRVCSSNEIYIFMELGNMPNSFHLMSSVSEEVYTQDMRLSYCAECGFVFFAEPMPSEELYGNYNWPTSYYPALHLKWLCKKIMCEHLSSKDDFIVEIGSNDGYFLKMFYDEGYHNLLGVEPAKDCSDIANSNGIHTINSYYDNTVAEIIKSNYAEPRAIICRHVIEHVWDIEKFVTSICSIITKDSIFVVEIPSFEVISEKGDFTSLWEQHVNYFCLETISRVFNRCGLFVEEHHIISFSCGSLLLFVKLNEQKNNIVNRNDLAQCFRKKARGNIDTLNSYLGSIKDNGGSIAAYGAGSKGSCLLNISGAYRHIDYIVDDNPKKIGLFLPGSKIPILSSEALYKENKPDYCIISPLNNKENEVGILDKHKKYTELGGKFIELFPKDFRNSLFIENT
ncbi:MAG: class I SAM-dependent methyltransferase [Clostridia bacterium]|nr:class I SAM-dependent methyltransferase [Clostridia bacterium]